MKKTGHKVSVFLNYIYPKVHGTSGTTALCGAYSNFNMAMTAEIFGNGITDDTCTNTVDDVHLTHVIK